MSLQLKFGPIDLSDIAQWEEDAPSRISETIFPRRPGSVVPVNPPAEARRINLTGEVYGADEAAFKTAMEQLNYQLSTAGRQRLQLRDDGRFYRAVKERFNYRYVAGGLPDRRAEIQIGFIADDPHLYAPSASEQTDVFPSNTWDFSITNNGLARTPPVFELTRSSGIEQQDIILTHTGTGLFMKISGTFAIGTKIIFDCVNRRVTQGGELALHLFSGVITFELFPGLNNFHYDGPGTASIYTTWHEKWP
jgi:hypothetical protein